MSDPNYSYLAPRKTDEDLSWREAEITTDYLNRQSTLHHRLQAAWTEVLNDVLKVGMDFQMQDAPIGEPVEIRVRRSEDGKRFRMIVGYRPATAGVDVL